MTKNFTLNMGRLGSLCRYAAVMLFFVGLSSVAMAQTRVSGIVTDESSAPVPGVNIVEKGTSNGTTTDSEGRYTMNVGGSNSILSFSFIGYITQEVQVGTQSTVDVALNPDVQALEEVVVTGYSIDKRRELTGSVSTVKTKDMTFAPSGNVEQMLQGRVAGVTVITNGQPGTTSQIRVRGFGAFGGNSPLYVVDGVPTQDISFLNPDDIETTTVLKDAASASIYGARAASGVIVYTTKRGKRGQKLNVTYDGMVGVTNPGTGQDMMNPTDFAQWTWNAIRNTKNPFGTFQDEDVQKAIKDFNHPQFGNAPAPVIPEYLSIGGKSGAEIERLKAANKIDIAAESKKYNVDPRNGGIFQVTKANPGGTDWYKAITRNAPVQRHSLGFSGGGDNNRFFVGLSAQTIAGILKENDYKRYVARVNTEFDVLKNFRIGENMQITYLERRGLSGGSGGQGISADENDILSAFRMPSIIPIYDQFGGYAGTASKGFNNPRNPVAARDGQANNKTFNTSGFGNIYAELDIIPGLTARTSIGGNYQTYNYRNYGRWQYENSENNSAFSYNQGSGYSFGWTFTNTLAYKKQFGEHSLELLGGQEAIDTGSGWGYDQQGLNPFSWDPNYINIANTSQVQIASADGNSPYRGRRFSSFFGNLKYTFRDRYILGAVVRRDGSSVFGATKRYGVFPAVSAAWRVSSESFMSAVPWIGDLKIRAGVGTMGNSNNVDPYNQYSLYGGDKGNSSYDITGSNSSAQTGYYRTRIGNPDAKWETSFTKNLGIDGILFDGKLDVIVDFWQKDTKDLLLAVPVTATAGYNASVPSVNIGKMVNKGIDISIGTKGNIIPGLQYEVSATGSFLKNEITSLAPGLTYLTTANPGFRGINPIRNQLGQSISSFYGYYVEGLFSSADDVAKHAQQADAAPGRFKYKDINGDNKIDENDRGWLGSPVPKFTGGITFTLRYMNFDLTAYGYTSVGNKIFNVSKWFTDFYPSFQGAAISERVKESWTPTNLGATTPIFESASNFSTNTQSNSFYVESGTFFRLQNLTVGYTLPAATLDKMKLNRLRVYATANNLFTITKYSGLDPAVGGAADTNFGIDVGNYPITRQFTLGLNLGF
jgi:TonB-linked SusC/RagA family outer membrane protein